MERMEPAKGTGGTRLMSPPVPSLQNQFVRTASFLASEKGIRGPWSMAASHATAEQKLGWETRTTLNQLARLPLFLIRTQCWLPKHFPPASQPLLRLTALASSAAPPSRISHSFCAYFIAGPLSQEPNFLCDIIRSETSRWIWTSLSYAASYLWRDGPL